MAKADFTISFHRDGISYGKVILSHLQPEKMIESFVKSAKKHLAPVKAEAIKSIGEMVSVINRRKLVKYGDSPQKHLATAYREAVAESKIIPNIDSASVSIRILNTDTLDELLPMMKRGKRVAGGGWWRLHEFGNH